MKQKGVVNTSKSSARSAPLVYRALLTQSGTNAPVATVLENTLGPVNYNRNDNGKFTVTTPAILSAAGSFGRVTLARDLESELPIVKEASVLFVDSETLRIFTADTDVNAGTTSLANDVLAAALFEIFVW